MLVDQKCQVQFQFYFAKPSRVPSGCKIIKMAAAKLKAFSLSKIQPVTSQLLHSRLYISYIHIYVWVTLTSNILF